MNEIIVIGDSDGHVRFIDQHLHILMWYKHFKLGSIQSLSFSTTTKDYAQTYSLEPIESDATIEYKKFLCKDFLVNTKTSVIGFVTKSGTDIRIVSQSTDGEVHGVACHPHLPRVCFGDYNGTLQLWDYDTKSIICSRHFAKAAYQVHSLRFNPQGNHIVVGFRNGHVQIVDAISLDDCLLHPFTYSKEAITHIEFAHDSSFMATAEADFTVSVYKYNSGVLQQQDKIATELYTFLGRYRSHYKEIVSLMFGQHPGTTQIRLLSLGKDRLLCEYDLEKSNYDELIIKVSEKSLNYLKK
jgi:cilia- and flagella-associated protein 251